MSTKSMPGLPSVYTGTDAGGLVGSDDKSVTPAEVAEQKVTIVVDAMIRGEQSCIDIIVDHVLSN